MNQDQMLDSIKNIAESLKTSESSVEAIKAIEQLQAHPDAKMQAITSIVNRTEQTKEEAFRQLASLFLHSSGSEQDKKK